MVSGQLLAQTTLPPQQARSAPEPGWTQQWRRWLRTGSQNPTVRSVACHAILKRRNREVHCRICLLSVLVPNVLSAFFWYLPHPAVLCASFGEVLRHTPHMKQRVLGSHGAGQYAVRDMCWQMDGSTRYLSSVCFKINHQEYFYLIDYGRFQMLNWQCVPSQPRKVS
jgi:hypothetical protein